MATALWCPGCEESLPEDSFARNASRKSGRQTYCRECQAKVNASHYVKSKGYQNPKRAARTAEVTARNKAWVLEYLSAHPCVDCGVADIRVLEFDHVGEKTADISKLIRGASLERLQAEMTQCEVVCANCHRIRTYERANTWRHAAWLTLNQPGDI